MVEIELENGWFIIHKNKQWLVAKKRRVIQKNREPKCLIKLYKTSSFMSLEVALKFYFHTVKLDENDITSWEELIAVYKEGNSLIKRWMEELNG